MCPEDRHEQRRRQTHQQLIDAAKQVFSTKGFHNASILDVTEAANVSKRTFYLHFTDREALIEEIALTSFEEIRVYIRDTIEHANLSQLQRSQQVVQAIFEFAASNHDLMQLVLGRNGSMRLNAITRDYLVQAMVLSMQDPQCYFRHDKGVPLELVASAKAGVIFQMLSWWVQNDFSYSPERMAETAADILAKGTNQFIEEKIASDS